MLLIHGLTGDENSMWVFTRDLPVAYWMVAPRAPHASQMPQGGYSWRRLAGEVAARSRLEHLRDSADALIRLVDEYTASVGFEAKTFDVMGFSQGAGISIVLALLHPQRIRKVAMLAGFVPDGVEELASQRPLEGASFFITHGTKDETVPIESARAAIETLEQAGAQVTYCEDDSAHKVGASCLRALKAFFASPDGVHAD